MQYQSPQPHAQMPPPGKPLQTRSWTKWLLIWLLALPVVIILQTAILLFDPDGGGVLHGVVNMVALLGGLYFFVGWIPMVISMKRKAK